MVPDHLIAHLMAHAPTKAYDPSGAKTYTPSGVTPNVSEPVIPARTYTPSPVGPHGATAYESYTTPTQVQQQLRGEGGLGAQLLAHAQRNYAMGRLAAFHRIAGLVGGDFQSAMGGDLSDPVSAYGHLSGLFASAAHAAGYADPRIYLRELMAQALKHQTGVPTVLPHGG